MAVKRYVKQYGSPIRLKRQQSALLRLKRKQTLIHRVLPLLFVGIGVFMLASVIAPMASYTFMPSAKLTAEAIEEPVGDVTSDDQLALMRREYLLPTPVPTPEVVSVDLDYTDLTNWFPQSIIPTDIPNSSQQYLLSIPKVNVEDAVVEVGGTNLDEHLIQYPGTALPGQRGSSIIFGHSVLRQFYNPAKENKRRYISIFSKIMTLQTGDVIMVESEGITYRYKVISKKDVKPDDPYLLEQDPKLRTVKLITCYPEGTYLRRGVITALLDDVQ